LALTTLIINSMQNQPPSPGRKPQSEPEATPSAKVLGRVITGLFQTPGQRTGGAQARLFQPTMVQSTPTSVMGNLLEDSANKVFAPDSLISTALYGPDGNPLSKEEIKELSQKIISSMTDEMTVKASSLIMGAPVVNQNEAMRLEGIQMIDQSIAPLIQTSAGAEEKQNPLKIANEQLRTDCDKKRRDFMTRTTIYLEAKADRAGAGIRLGNYMRDQKTAIQIREVPEDSRSSIQVASIERIEGSSLTLSEVQLDLKAAKEYAGFTEDEMWSELTQADVRNSKAQVEAPSLPKIFNPTERKTVLASLLKWTYEPQNVREFSFIICDIRDMLQIMDVMTGIYRKPSKALLQTPEFKEVYLSQDKMLARILKEKFSSVDFTSLWTGSSNVGAGDFKELYQIDQLSGVDLLYVYISQYVLIETGSSRTEVLLSLKKIAEFFKGPEPIEGKEMKIRLLLENCNEASVSPDFVTHGSKVLRAIVQRGQAYSDALSDEGLRKGGSWAVEPRCRDVTRMILDLIQIVKRIDTEEQLFEEDDDKDRGSKKRDRVGAMQVSSKGTKEKWSPSEALTKKLKAADCSEAANVSKAKKVQIHAVMIAAEPSINLDKKHKGINPHDGKLVAGKILLSEGQELTMEKLCAAGKMIQRKRRDHEDERPTKKSKSDDNEWKTCEASSCEEYTGNSWKKYCSFHFDLWKNGKTVWRKDGSSDHQYASYSSGGKSGSKGKGKGKGKSKGKGKDWSNGGKGKGKAQAVKTTDASGRVQTFYLDSQTLQTMAKMKKDGAVCMTDAQIQVQKQQGTLQIANDLLQQ
jgi:hypothetical protein